MKKLLGALLLLFAFSGNALAAKPVATGSIDVITPVPQFGQYVQFSATVTSKYDCLGKAGCARVYIECFQNDVLVYGEAGSIFSARNFGGDPTSPNTFILGAGSSQWVSNGGGPANCVAHLFRFDDSGRVQTYQEFDSVEFHAIG